MVDQTSQFYAILTTVGAAKQANADALGIPWKITHMAVGDGNPSGMENPPLPMPNAGARALLNEWRRAPLNQLKVDDKDSAVIVAEQVIPADVGGRWIREIALYDADGDMVAVANCAPTYKPLLNQGSGRTQVVRMNLVVSSASNVQLKIDPSVVLATREWVTEELAKQDFKHSVLVATTAAVTLSGLQTVDGVALTAGARVLVKNQAAGKENGLYLVVAGGAWTRCSDADTSAKVTPGMLVLVEKGTVNADSAWQLVADGPVTLGVSALTYEMAFGRTGVLAGTYRSVAVDAYGRVVAATNPTTVAGYGLTDVYTKTQIDQALTLKAPLASPALTGTPTSPTPALAVANTTLATTEFVHLLLGSVGWGASGVNGTNIGAGINLDTMVTPGSFGQRASANTSLALRYPVALAGTLFVQAASAAIITQQYMVYNTGRLYTRGCYEGVWSEWNDIGVVDSPAFRGTPSAPTAAKGTNTTQLATTAFVQAAVAALVDAAPGSLDTLKELAAALGNDSNFAVTITNAIAAKVATSDKASQSDAEVGTDNVKWMTPLRVFQAIGKVVTQATETAFGWAKIATQAQVNAGLDDTTIVTPRKQRLGFSVSLAANGFIVFPTWLGGVILQWGTAGTTNGFGTWTYPLTFPNSVFRVFASNDASASGSSMYACGAHPNAGYTSAAIASQLATGGDAIYLFAIGY
ncbi:phage tail protein [Pseudomonas sp. H9]|uniref:phage tail-collar fiber domain-containing protein n=1 Tax=Pseudomonas sp. H9 TaxID=483968 RepID=UPI0021149594|nr:phage tail protein [Pseudomonas sp. H9]